MLSKIWFWQLQRLVENRYTIHSIWTSLLKNHFSELMVVLAVWGNLRSKQQMNMAKYRPKDRVLLLGWCREGIRLWWRGSTSKRWRTSWAIHWTWLYNGHPHPLQTLQEDTWWLTMAPSTMLLRLVQTCWAVMLRKLQWSRYVWRSWRRKHSSLNQRMGLDRCRLGRSISKWISSSWDKKNATWPPYWSSTSSNNKNM